MKVLSPIFPSKYSFKTLCIKQKQTKKIKKIGKDGGNTNQLEYLNLQNDTVISTLVFLGFCLLAMCIPYWVLEKPAVWKHQQAQVEKATLLSRSLLSLLQVFNKEHLLL